MLICASTFVQTASFVQRLTTPGKRWRCIGVSWHTGWKPRT